MNNVNIKEEHKDKKVAFKGSRGKTLGELNDDQKRDLALIAQQSGDTSLLELFEGDLPSVEELQQSKTEVAKKNLGPAPKSTPGAVEPGK